MTLQHIPVHITRVRRTHCKVTQDNLRTVQETVTVLRDNRVDNLSGQNMTNQKILNNYTDK